MKCFSFKTEDQEWEDFKKYCREVEERSMLDVIKRFIRAKGREAVALEEGKENGGK